MRSRFLPSDIKPLATLNRQRSYVCYRLYDSKPATVARFLQNLLTAFVVARGIIVTDDSFERAGLAAGYMKPMTLHRTTRLHSLQSLH